jgi:hypothetical protein
MNNDQINNVAEKAVRDLKQVAIFINTFSKHGDENLKMAASMALILTGFIEVDIRRLQEAARNTNHSISNN